MGVCTCVLPWCCTYIANMHTLPWCCVHTFRTCIHCCGAGASRAQPLHKMRSASLDNIRELIAYLTAAMTSSFEEAALGEMYYHQHRLRLGVADDLCGFSWPQPRHNHDAAVGESHCPGSEARAADTKRPSDHVSGCRLRFSRLFGEKILGRSRATATPVT